MLFYPFPFYWRKCIVAILVCYIYVLSFIHLFIWDYRWLYKTEKLCFDMSYSFVPKEQTNISGFLPGQGNIREFWISFIKNVSENVIKSREKIFLLDQHYKKFKVAVRVFSKKNIIIFLKTFLECFFQLYQMSSKSIRFYFLEFTKNQIFLFYLNHLMNILCWSDDTCVRKNLVYSFS